MKIKGEGYRILINWSNNIRLFVFLILTTLLFLPLLLKLGKVWISEEDYSHGFFVIPIALLILWQKRSKLLSTPLQPTWLGFPIFLGGAILYLIAYTIKFHTLTYLSMIVTLLGLILFLTGPKWMKGTAISVLFLLFMFPIPSAYYVAITNPLKLIITKISAQLIYLLGIPVYYEGNLLFMSTMQLEVAEACSGIRSIYSYLMLSVIFALMASNRVVQIILIVSTIPLALFINILRVTGTGILANSYGAKVSQGFFHEFSGIALFIVGLILFFAEFQLLQRLFKTGKR